MGQELTNYVDMRVVFTKIIDLHDVWVGYLFKHFQLLLHQSRIYLSFVHFRLLDDLDGAGLVSLQVSRLVDITKLACAKFFLELVDFAYVFHFMEAFCISKLEKALNIYRC